ncbi:hypothetical protein SLA2020_502970 [Shorea laevis]
MPRRISIREVHVPRFGTVGFAAVGQRASGVQLNSCWIRNRRPEGGGPATPYLTALKVLLWANGKGREGTEWWTVELGHKNLDWTQNIN